MNKVQVIVVYSIVGLMCNAVWGHGTAIKITVVDGRLRASHSSDQFAPSVFGQSDEFDDFAQADFFSTLGNVILWDIPGLDIHGMDDAASLSIEILSRPIIGSAPPQDRLLWYWNPVNEAVEVSSAEFHLLGTGMRSLTLQPEDQQSPAPFLLAGFVAGETGFHNHSLLLYALDDDVTAPAGVYGFFARFTSDSYISSDPFLIVFNYFADSELLSSASLAIHEAATLPGDFDFDDDVDGRDFLVWQRLFGSTTRTGPDASLNGVVDSADLSVWQEHYGNVFGNGSPLRAFQVPEPTTSRLFLTLISVLLEVCLSRRRHRGGAQYFVVPHGSPGSPGPLCGPT